MTVPRRFGSLILTVSLLALLTAGSVLVSQATSERNTTTTTEPAADPAASSIEGMATSPSATNESPSKKLTPAGATSPTNAAQNNLSLHVAALDYEVTGPRV